MSLNYEHISEEEVTDLICSLLNDYEKKQQNLFNAGSPDVFEWQDLVNASREFIEVATMNTIRSNIEKQPMTGRRKNENNIPSH